MLRGEAPRHIQIRVPGLRDPEVQARIRAEVASHNAQTHRWADILDDAEAFAPEFLMEESPQLG